MAYNKKTSTFRKQLFKFLYKLADKGCGDGGWCECLLCRVMRVVQTEKFRNQPSYKSSWAGYQKNPATDKTEMINWRGGQIEFAKGSSFESVSDEPWYALELTRRNDEKKWIYWIDYGGPPELYLTRKAAVEKAKELREQYKGTYKSVKVVKIGKI